MTDQRQQIPTSNTDSNIQTQRPPFLRRCSISDPHLDILPQKFGQEKGLNPFNRVLSGLFEGSAFSLNKFGSNDSVDKEGHRILPQQNKPASQEHLVANIQPKLGGNSAIDLKNSPPSAAGGLRKSATSISALFGSSPHQHHPFPTIPETDDQGLTMSAKPSASFANMDKAANTQSTEATSPQKSGGFMKMFGAGGFLSRPVLHSPEEQYRYIMALDR